MGLARSQVAGATMGCQSALPDTEKRSLEPDEQAGLCDAYPPGLAFAGDYVDGKWQPLRRAPSGACATYATASGPRSGIALLAIAALALIRRRSQRSASNSRSHRHH